MEREQPRVILRVPSRLTLPGGEAHSVDTSLASTPARSAPHSPLHERNDDDGATDMGAIIVDDGDEQKNAPLPAAASVTDQGGDDEYDDDHDEAAVAQRGPVVVDWEGAPAAEEVYERILREPVTVARDVYRLGGRHDLTAYMTDLATVMAMQSRSLELLAPLIDEEVGEVFSKERAMTLLRSPSPLSYLFSAMLNSVMRAYVHAMLDGPMQHLQTHRLADGADATCGLFVDSIVAATERELKRPNSLLGRVYACVNRAVQRRFDDAEDQDDVFGLVCANSLFLRCVAPTIMQPVEMGLLPNGAALDPAFVHDCVAVARPLQTLAQQKPTDSEAMDALAARIKALYGQMRTWAPKSGGGGGGGEEEEEEECEEVPDEKQLRAAVEHIEYLLSGRAGEDERVAREAAEQERQEKRAAREAAAMERNRPRGCFDTCVVRRRSKQRKEDNHPPPAEPAAEPAGGVRTHGASAAAAARTARGQSPVMELDDSSM